MAEDKKNSLSQLALLRMLQDATSSPAADEFIKANPQEFKDIVTRSAEKNPMIKANVTDYSLDDYQKMKTFLSGDKQSGYAIKPKEMTDAKLRDELISVFSNKKGRGEDILKNAVDIGGAKQLDAFDINNKLPSLYGKEFKETSRMKFDPQYAPADWDYKKLGTPDVVGMELDNSLKKLAPRVGRQALSAALKAGLPAAALAAASDSSSLDDAISNLVIPGGVESLGSPEEEAALIGESQGYKNYKSSPAAASRRAALEKLSQK